MLLNPCPRNWGKSIRTLRHASPGSQPGRYQRHIRVSLVLTADVRYRPPHVANAHRPKIVAGSPLQFRTRHHTIPIRDSRTRALETLNQAWDIDERRQFEYEMYVVTHDPDLENPRGVPVSDLREQALQKCSGARVDER